MTEPAAQDGGLERVTREFTYRQTSRFTLAVTDPAAVAAASAACRAAHGQPWPDGTDLPPTVAVSALAITEVRNSEDVEVMDDPVLGAVWRLLECGRHGVIDGALDGVEPRLANHSGEIGPWPPWPAAEAL